MDRPWLLLRHHGCLWGVPRGQVRSISHPDGIYRLQVGCHLLEVDEVVSLVCLSKLRRFGPVLAPLAPAGCTGLASSSLGPVMMIDAASPPAVLRAPDPAAAQPRETASPGCSNHPAHPDQI